MTDDAPQITDVPTEKSLNRLLRRVDWRFLIPRMEPPRVSAYGAGTRLEGGLRAFSGRVSSLEATVPGAADLVVGAGRRELSALRQALAPGGVCLAEWRGPVAGGAGEIGRRMARAGFTDVSCYWAWPLPGRRLPQFWLPLESPAAATFLLESRAPLVSAFEDASRATRDAAWRLQSRAGLLAPVSALGSAAGGDRSAAGLAAVLGSMLGEGDAAPVRWLLLTRGRRSTNKVVALPFVGTNPRPLLMVKIARLPESDLALEHEAGNLDVLHDLAPRLVARVPRALGVARVGGRVAVAESFVEGTALSALLRENTFHRHARAAAEWLTNLIPAGPRSPRAEWWDRLVADPFVAFRQTFGEVADPADLRTTEEQLALLPDLPLAFEHRDFAPWNLALGLDGDLVAYDWESSEPYGLPVIDLVYFLTHAAFFVDGALESGRLEETYTRVFDPRSPLGRLAGEALSLYLNRIDLPPDVLRPLRLLTWLIHTRPEYARLLADVGEKPGPGMLRDGVFFRLWQHEARFGGANL